ncbi:Ig-like domain-containing protein [Microvirga zambiensis]|uniref:Ig-like domain-containing protein n=1 Tax=Microvirga zambiensis TaxID=1402137 RepID=UPI00191E258E|nr:Ig-like domain-containing protein [Microvirga zambiensis]
MASTITLDGQLTDWTNIDRLDFGMTGLNGSKVYGRYADGTYYFAIESSAVSIGTGSTMWLNTDKSTATGYSFWGIAIGADYKIEFEADELGGVRPALYSLAGNGDATLVTDGVSFKHSTDGRVVELAIDKVKIGNSTAVSTLIDLNDSTYLPDPYSAGPFTLTDDPIPVRTDTNLKVAIVFSESSAARYWEGKDAEGNVVTPPNPTAYSQLIMAAQSQAIAAGVPFDILTESDLTNLSKVVNYDAIIFPSFTNVNKDKLSAIEDVLADAVNKYGISLVAAGNFMTNDETGVALPDTYARMEALLGVKRVGSNNVDEVTVTASGVQSGHVIGYDSGEQIRTYVKNATSLVGTAYFEGVNGESTQVLATQSASDGTHNAVLATQTGGNNVFFATESMLADSNMLQHAIGWAARPENVPELKLQMGRQASIFAARNDMDQSQEAQDVSQGIYTKLGAILEQWKEQFDFVGSYYVNIGNDAEGGQTTDWDVSTSFYQQLLAMGNEIGTHSYTHPEDTNLLTPAQIQFEFEQSKLLLEQKLGITIEGAAVPGAPESLATSQLIGQYFSYMTGGYTGVGAGYPGAFGYLTPDSDKVYLAPNIKFDFSLVEALPEYGGGMNAAAAKAEWIKEFNELSMKSDMPVFVWPWHDYGPTQWMVNPPTASPYTLDMYSDFLKYAYEQGTEFVTMADLAYRIKAFEKAGFNYSFDSASNTMTATVTADVTANQIGTFALDVEKGKTIASVSGWYAYDEDSVFMDADGGTFKIKLGTPEDVTHITALPARAQLVSVTGDGVNLDFSIKGEGKIAIDLVDPQGRQLIVTGADIASRNGDKLELKVNGSGSHTVSVKLKPLALGVALAYDTGISSTDRVTSNGNLKVTGVASGASVEYSVDGSTWTKAFTPTQGNNTVYVRQKDSTGATSDATPFSFELDNSSPTLDITQARIGSSKAIQATFTFSKAVDPSSFTAQDVLVTGATMESFSFNGGTTYTATLTPSMSNGGKFSIAVNNAAYADVSSNAGTGVFKIFDVTKSKATSGADWLVGTNGNNTLKGGGGDDIIRGGKGNDTISGDGGKDLLDFSDGKKGIKITLSQENSKYTTFDGRSAGLGIDKYRDMEGVIGTKFADTITGSSSADTLAGLGGNDILRGGRGNDVFVFESNGGRDKIMDFEDTGSRHDKLDVRFFDFDVTSSSFAAWKTDHVKQQGSHTIVSFDATTSVQLMNIKAKAIGFDDFLF